MSLIKLSFHEETDLVHAVEFFRKEKFVIHDVFAPYPVHGLDQALGWKPSKLTYICFVFALLGLLSAIYAQFWIGSINWPLNVGGKPFNSLPAYLPVTFELTVLFGGLGSFFTFLFYRKLFPGKKPALCFEEALDDTFVVLMESMIAYYSLEEISRLGKNFHATDVSIMEGIEE
jgi:hypothetical protein